MKGPITQEHMDLLKEMLSGGIANMDKDTGDVWVSRRGKLYSMFILDDLWTRKLVQYQGSTDTKRMYALTPAAKAMLEMRELS